MWNILKSECKIIYKVSGFKTITRVKELKLNWTRKYQKLKIDFPLCGAKCDVSPYCDLTNDKGGSNKLVFSICSRFVRTRLAPTWSQNTPGRANTDEFWPFPKMLFQPSILALWRPRILGKLLMLLDSLRLLRQLGVQLRPQEQPWSFSWSFGRARKLTAWDFRLNGDRQLSPKLSDWSKNRDMNRWVQRLYTNHLNLKLKLFIFTLIKWNNRFRF